MRRVLGIALALSLAQAGEVFADDAAARAEASRLTAQSAEAEKRGDHLAALDGLRNAYRVFPSANLHYNIASMLAKLGMFAEAADEYEAFLAGAPGLAGEVPQLRPVRGGRARQAARPAGDQQR